MKLLVLESFLAGMGGPISSLPASLVREAKAMLGILLESLAFDETKEIRVLIHPDADVRVPDTIHATWSGAQPWVDFLGLLCRCDAFWPIAPESGGLLQALACQSRRYNVKTLVPDEPFLGMACDKWLTCQFLRSHGLPTPESSLAGQPVATPGPWVVKPRDGVGSQDVRRVENQSDLPVQGEWLIQPLVRGRPISQSLVGGPQGVWFMPPCSQILASDGSFEYQGGTLPLAQADAHRAETLTRRLAKVLDRFDGWIGVDMILGDDPNGTEDTIIEINPRLTTSFAGVARLSREPLAPKIVDHGMGKSVPAPDFAPGCLRFHADGSIEALS